MTYKQKVCSPWRQVATPARPRDDMKSAAANDGLSGPRHTLRATRTAGRQMRSRLLDAASRLFKERGLAAVSQDNGDEDNRDPHPQLVDAPAPARAAVSAAVAALVVDAYVDAEVRQEAFAVARLLRGDRYAQLLADVADQAELEGTSLLAAAEAELRQQRGLGK